MKKKIAYISGSRADFNLEAPLLREIDQSKVLDLQLFVTGMHLMPKFGKTVNLVKEKFPKSSIINIKFEKDSHEGMAIFAVKFAKEIVNEFKKNRPDLVLVHGDRIEMLCTTLVAFYMGLPIIHVQGGDKTSTVDDSARHAITKMSNLHFPATKKSAERIKMMGEESWRVNVVGTMGVDALLEVQTLSKTNLYKKLKLSTNSKFILVLYHPISEEMDLSGEHMQKIINACKRFNIPVVIIYPNSDPGSSQIIEVINKEKNNPLFRIFKNLDYSTFVSLEKYVDVWVGNSSAGVVESASFKTPVVNIGIRQNGREKGINVIDVGVDEEEIYLAIKKSLYDQKYLKSLEKCVNPWGDGKATKRILRILENLAIDKKLLIKK